MSLDTAATTKRTVASLAGEHPLAQVDLMPLEVLADRRFRTARVWMALAAVGTVAVGAGVFALASADADNADAALALEQARTTELNAEAAQYAAVPAVLASVDRAEGALSTAMATDIEWYRYVSQMAAVAPQGVWFTSMTLTATAPAADAVAGDPLAPVGAVGDVLTVGRALSSDDVATWMDDVSTITGYDYALVTGATANAETATEPFVDFQVSVKVLPEAYSHRYDPEAN